MTRAERELYDDVTRYLLEPGIIAFQGRHRQLLLLMQDLAGGAVRAIDLSRVLQRWSARQ